MKRSLLLGLAVLPLLALIQAEPAPCQAQLQLEQQGLLLRVTGLCRSHLDQAARYRYELRALRHSPAGQANTTQRGAFEVLAQQEVTLSQVGFSMGRDSHYHLHLLVYDDAGHAVAQDSAAR